MIESTVCCPLAACAKHGSCTRYANYVKNCAESDFFSLLNKDRIHPTEEGCPHYIVPRNVIIAYGFTRLYNTLPTGNSKSLFMSMDWGSASTYFRTKRGERSLSPQVQERILSIVRQNGGNPAVGFDRYVDAVMYVKP